MSEKRGRGRPRVERRLLLAMDDKLHRAGLSRRKLALIFNVSAQTVNIWADKGIPVTLYSEVINLLVKQIREDCNGKRKTSTQTSLK